MEATTTPLGCAPTDGKPSQGAQILYDFGLRDTADWPLEQLAEGYSPRQLQFAIDQVKQRGQRMENAIRVSMQAYLRGILSRKPAPETFDSAAHVVQRPMDQAERLRAAVAESERKTAELRAEQSVAATDEQRRAALASVDLDWRRHKQSQIAGGK